MAEIDYTIRTAVQSDRSQLANLIHFGTYIHQHLDWKSPLDWINRQPYIILEKEGSPCAALACPPELPGIAWIRLFAVGANVKTERAWTQLWNAACTELEALGQVKVVGLSLQNWFNVLLAESDFEHIDNVVVLLWEENQTIQRSVHPVIAIRPMLSDDLEVVIELDSSAFSDEWKNSPESLELAYQQSSIASIAEIEGEIVGYQCSTRSSMGGHLARLAVKPSYQGHGIGYSLVCDLLNKFHKIGVSHVTVNTQQKNIASLALYEKAGFKFTGESYRVYQKTIGG